jgi:hypothetical protein
VVLLPATWYAIVQPMLFGETTINYSIKSCQCWHCLDRLRKR